MNFQQINNITKVKTKIIKKITIELFIFFFSLIIMEVTVKDKTEYKYLVTTRLFFKKWKILIVSDYLSQVEEFNYYPFRKLKEMWKGFDNGKFPK